MAKEMPDMHVKRMAELMGFLTPWPKITQSYGDPNGRSTGGFDSQKSHMVIWFASQPESDEDIDPFSYGRRKGNASARTAYNRFSNPYGLLWLAECFGEEETTLRCAMDAAEEAGKVSYRSRCKGFRLVIPFERIIELQKNPKRWLYDPALLPLLTFDETGWPSVTKENRPEYQGILSDEWCLV